MIDATAIAAEIDDYSAWSIRPEFFDANGHLTARLTGLGTGTVHRLERETDCGLPRLEHGGALSVGP